MLANIYMRRFLKAWAQRGHEHRFGSRIVSYADDFVNELPDGYDFDYINADVLIHRASVKGGRIAVPDGPSYAVLVLPKQTEMRPRPRSRGDGLVELNTRAETGERSHGDTVGQRRRQKEVQRPKAIAMEPKARKCLAVCE